MIYFVKEFKLSSNLESSCPKTDIHSTELFSRALVSMVSICIAITGSLSYNMWDHTTLILLLLTILMVFKGRTKLDLISPSSAIIETFTHIGNYRNYKAVQPIIRPPTGGLSPFVVEMAILLCILRYQIMFDWRP